MDMMLKDLKYATAQANKLSVSSPLTIHAAQVYEAISNNKYVCYI